MQVEAWRDAPPAWSDLQRIQYYDLIAALPDKLLVKVDRSLMAWGVEARVPYLDHRIVEFGLGLPDALKVQGRMGKVLPAPMGPAPHPGAVPDAVEEGLSRADAADPARRVPARSWARRLTANEAIRSWFKVDGVKGLIEAQQHTGGHSDQVWGLLQFAIWHRLFVEQPGRMPGRSEDPLDWIR